MSNPNYNKLYWQYARDVLDENITTGKYIKLACKRMFDFAERDDIYFDEEDVDKKIRFVQKMKHSEGKHAGEQFVLLNYQQWIYANIFGWKYKDSNKRVPQNYIHQSSHKRQAQCLPCRH